MKKFAGALVLLVLAVVWALPADAASRNKMGIGSAGATLCDTAFVDCIAACSFIPGDSQSNDFAHDRCRDSCENAVLACKMQPAKTVPTTNVSGSRSTVTAEPPTPAQKQKGEISETKGGLSAD